MFPMQFAAEEMSAILPAGFMKSVLWYGLIACGILWYMAPTLWEKLKTALVTGIEKKLSAVLPDTPQPYGAPTYGTASTVAAQGAGQIAQQRAAELRAVCPKAPASMRLKWLESGVDPAKAQSEYIAMLEDQLSPEKPATPQ